MSDQRNTLNLGTWLRRFGYTRPDPPELVYAVQPVEVVGDASALTPRYAPPSGAFGGNIASAAQPVCYQIGPGAPGGTLVYDHQFTPGNTGWWWRLFAGRLSFTTTTAATLQPYTLPATTNTLCEFGSNPSLDTGTNPRSAAAGNVTYHLPNILIPPGYWLFVQSSATSSARFMLNFEEYVAENA